MDFKELKDHAVVAAKAAGHIITERAGSVSQLGFEKKLASDFVTSVDREAEKVIINILQDNYPEIPFLAEESGDSGGDHAYRWIVDPLDGTTNFIHGYPWVAVSIALERVSGNADFGDPVIGVVLNPFAEDLFTAIEGQGAHHNEKQLQVSGTSGLDGALLATGFPFRNRDMLDEYLTIFRELFNRCHGIRRAGSAALDLAWLAAGAFDGFWEYGLSPWDTAAGALMIREASGVVSEFDGSNRWLETGNIAAGTPGVHPKILKVIQRFREKK